MSDLWTGEFGDSYTRRNTDSTLEARRSMWSMLLPSDCKSVLEVGANTGLNLAAIELNQPNMEFYACEPNDMAREELEANGVVPALNITADYADKLRFPDEIVDLAFTSGVLIHIPAEKLIPSMREIHRCAKKWIICGEYFAPSEEMVPYRGHMDVLWRRNYGGLWLDNFLDLRCTACLFAWDRLTGLDNLTYWVFHKGAKPH